MTLKERYLYNKAISSRSKEDYINAIYEIDVLKNTDRVAQLLYYFLNTIELSYLDELSDDSLAILMTHYFNIYGLKNLNDLDFKYINKRGLSNVVLNYETLLINQNKTEDLIEVVKMSTVYDEKVLFPYLKEKNALHKLYYKIKCNKILDYVLESSVIKTYIYENYVLEINEEYKEKFLDKMMEDNKVYEILNAIDSDYHNDVLKGWRKYKDYLSTKDIYAIIQYKVYEEDDIQFLVTKACELMDAENIYLFLSDEYPITSELIIYQKEKLEKALKETRDIQYNFYYEYKKDKDELIRKMGGTAALILFIATNEIDLEKGMHDELCLLAEESLSNDTFVENALFKDEQKSCKVTAKRIKKQNKPCNN